MRAHLRPSSSTSFYDVQPATEAGWLVPPFSANIVELPGYGSSIVGRGTFNSKGPLSPFSTASTPSRSPGTACR